MHPFMLSLIASAGLGAMIGLIRQLNEQSEKPHGDHDYAGLRTFTFWCLLGCASAYISEEYSPAVLPVVLLVVGAHFVIGRQGTQTRSPGGSTTFVAALLTVLVGALVFWKQHQEAVVLSALMVVLIGLKNPIHKWTRAFTEHDIRATLQFVAVTGVILPLVPNRGFGPFEAFNPHSVWMMVVLISGIGFGGYVLMRLLDARSGLFLTSLLGGIASSTATTLAFSRESRDDPAHSPSYAMAVAIACTVMLPRVLVMLGLVNREFALQLIVPFAVMAGPGILYVGWSWWRQHRQHREAPPPAIANPLSLLTAMKFAAIYAVVSFLVKAAGHYERLEDALLPLAFVSGLTDVDAISLSIAHDLKTGGEALGLAAKAIVLAAIANTILKTVLAVSFGSPVLRRHLVVLMSATVAAGIAGFLLAGGDAPAAPAS
jgi:uncharacterized membrane protein (DUF4010 family)